MPEQFPKISIVTVSYNQGPYIEDCIKSVIEQEYPNLEYIIIDGGSTDGTLDIIRKYEDYISFYVSEKDNGTYHALHKGFLRSTGEIMGWVNSDDLLNRKSLFALAEIFTTFSHVNWLQGYPTVADEMGRIVYHRKPRNNRFDFLQKKYRIDGAFIQQESTYWRRSLWELSGSNISTEFKYAGDFELWMRFFKHEVLYTTEALLGTFRVRGKGQLSADNYTAYLAECDIITDKAVTELTASQAIILKNAVVRKKNKISALLSRFVSKQVCETPGKNIYYDFSKPGFKINEE